MPLFDYEDEIIEERVRRPRGERVRGVLGLAGAVYRGLKRLAATALLLAAAIFVLPFAYGFTSALLTDFGIALSPTIGNILSWPAEQLIEWWTIVFNDA